MPQFACDDQFIWLLYVRRDTIVKSRVPVVCNDFQDESPDTCKAPLPHHNVSATFEKISPIEEGEIVPLFQLWILVQSWYLVLSYNIIHFKI
jgi:hypothetical protein